MDSNLGQQVPALFQGLSGNGQTGPGGAGAVMGAFHEQLRAIPTLRGVTRLVVALYDQGTDTLSTFVGSEDPTRPPIGSVAMRLSSLPTLAHLGRQGGVLVVDDLTRADRAHDAATPTPSAPTISAPVTRALVARGIRSRYIATIQRDGRLVGFIFANANQAAYFRDEVLTAMEPFRAAAAATVVAEMARVQAVTASIAAAKRLAGITDGETAGHLARVSAYTDILARALIPKYGFDNETITYMRLYAPLHDLGKMSVPAEILFKPGALTAHERAVIETHVDAGVAMVDALAADLGDSGVPRLDVLRALVAHHHECPNGGGYPQGLRGDDIPPVGRVMAVADVFDALTSERPYKTAWPDARAMSYLRDNAGTLFDRACVDALDARIESVREARRRVAASTA